MVASVDSVAVKSVPVRTERTSTRTYHMRGREADSLGVFTDSLGVFTEQAITEVNVVRGGACCHLSAGKKFCWTKFLWGWEDFFRLPTPASQDAYYLEGWRQAAGQRDNYPG